MCRLIRISLQVTTPLVLIQRDHVPGCIEAGLFDHGSFNTGKFARTFYEFLALLLHFHLQLIEGGRMNFPLRIPFGMRQPFTLILPKHPIWPFHSGEHSQAVTI